MLYTINTQDSIYCIDPLKKNYNRKYVHRERDVTGKLFQVQLLCK